MADNDLRARVVERLARADYERWQRAYDKISEHQEWGDKAPSWTEAAADHKKKAEVIRKAEVRVDDLGDMLPTLTAEPVGYITGYRNADGGWHVMFDGAPFATHDEAEADAQDASLETPEFDWRALTLSEGAPRDDWAETAKSLAAELRAAKTMLRRVEELTREAERHLGNVRAIRLRAVLEGKTDA